MPIPGASADVAGLRLIAEGTTGRRNRIDTVLVRRVDARPEHRRPTRGEAARRCLRSSTAEDAKLVTLARSARARIGAVEGAAVRDGDGRTYAAATVSLPSLTLTALQLAVANAVSSGAVKLEAAVVVTEASTWTDLVTLRSATCRPTPRSTWPVPTAPSWAPSPTESPDL